MAPRYCCFFNCNNNEKDHLVKLFSIPSADLTRAKKWIINSGNLKLLDLEKEKLKNRYVCEKHFLASDFYEHKGGKKLKANVVPQKYLNKAEVLNLNFKTDNSKQNDKNVPLRRNIKRPYVFGNQSEEPFQKVVSLPCTVTSSSSETTKNKAVRLKIVNIIPSHTTPHSTAKVHEENQETIFFQAQPPTKTYAKISQKSKYERRLELEENNVDDVVSKIMQTNNDGVKFLEEIAEMPYEFKKRTANKNKLSLVKTINKQRKQLLSRRIKIDRLVKQNAKLKAENSIKAQLEKHTFLSENTRIITNMQLRDGSSRKPWELEQKNYALGLFFSIGETNYNKLRHHGQILPAISTIRSWLQQYKYSPGINECFMTHLEKIGLDMKETDKICVITYDEMAIMEALEYSRHLDYIEGFEDLGHDGRSPCLAKYALAFMMSGIFKKYKFPLAYFLSKTGVKGKTLAKLITYVIEEVIKAGFTPVIMISDQASNNALAMKTLKVTTENPFCYIQGRKIIAIFDPPHLMKNLRNNLLNGDYIYEEDKHISFKDIKQLYEIDKISTKSRAVPRLTEAHINPSNFEKMRVKLAVQVLSGSVHCALEKCIERKQITSTTVQNTSYFVKIVNDCWDALNSKEEKVPNRNNCALSASNPQVEQTLLDTKMYISKLKKIDHLTYSQKKQRSQRKVISNKTRKFNQAKANERRISTPPCFVGLQQTINGILMLYHDLIEKYDNIYYLRTNRLSQDCLENFFGTIRMGGGSNRNPTAKTFRQLFRSRALNYLIKSDSSNSQTDDSLFFNIEKKTSLSTNNESNLDANKFVDKPIEFADEPDSDDEFLSQVVFNFENTNMQPIMESDIIDDSDNESIYDNNDDDQQVKDQATTIVPFPGDDFQIENPPEVKTLEDDAVEFFAGFLARTLTVKLRKPSSEKQNCNCIALIVRSDTVEGSLIHKRTYEGIPHGKGLKYPTEEFTLLIDQALQDFGDYFKEVWSGKSVLEKCTKHIYEALKSNALTTKLCKDHLDYMIQKMIRTRAHYYCSLFIKNRRTKEEDKMKILEHR